MTESEFDGMFHPTSPNPKLPVDAFDSDPDDPPTLRLGDLANERTEPPHSSELGNLADHIETEGEL